MRQPPGASLTPGGLPLARRTAASRVSYPLVPFAARLVISVRLQALASPPPADRILVVRLGALGDVVRTLPAVSSLRAGYAGAHIAWLVEPPSATALRGQPWVDEVLVFPRGDLVEALRRGHLPGLWQRFAPFARELRERRFDLVLDFHSILRSALLARLSGAPRRIGYARPFGRELSPLFATDRARLGSSRISRFERNQALVRFLGIDAAPARRPLRVGPAARSRAAAALSAAPGAVALHPGSSGGTAHKRWAPEGYGRLARRLAEGGAPSLVTWGPAPGERDVARAVVAASQGAARLAPETPGVDDLAALLAGCRLYVGGDTGPLHVASLVGTPVVQMLGPTDPVENAPWSGTPSRSVRWVSGGGAGASLSRELDAAFAASCELLAGGAPGPRGAPADAWRARGAVPGPLP